MNKLLFFCISSALLLFSIIALNLAPGFKYGSEWYDESCKSISDDLKYFEDDFSGNKETKDEFKKFYKKNKSMCNRKKTMIGFEYASFNANIIFGFICAFLGFIQYFDIKKIEVTGIIGLVCGLIGFVLTLVYIIESGLVFTDIDDDLSYRIDSDGALLELKDNNYVCIFYNKKNKYSLFRRFSDYGNKYLNYNKKVIHKKEDKNYEFQSCIGSLSLYSNGNGYNDDNDYDDDNDDYRRLSLDQNDFYRIISVNEYCKGLEEKTIPFPKREYFDSRGTKLGDCKKLYSFSSTRSNERKNIFDRWVATIILSCFNLLFNIGVAIFGFLSFNSSGKTNF